MNSFIISADDFGQSPRANKNILRLVELGKIQRVSVMANGKISQEEIAKLIKSGIKLDIHLEMPYLSSSGDSDETKSDLETRGSREKYNSKFPELVQVSDLNQKILESKGSSQRLEPTHVGSNDKKNSRSNKDSVFFRSLRFILLYLSGRISSRKIEKHWNSQIKKFQKIFGKNPDGLNSHEHVHFFPPYFKIALKLCQKYKISHIRAADNIIPNNSHIGWIIKFLNSTNNKHFTRYTLHVTRYTNLVSLDWIKDFDNFLDSLIKSGNDNKTIEIVCHPEREEESKMILDFFSHM